VASRIDSASTIVNTPSERTRVVFELLIIAACCYFLFMWGAGSFGLLGADEPRYAQIAREMMNRNDWITPTLNGTAWLEKPVLYYWRANIAYPFFGVNNFAAGVPAATFGALITFVVYFFMRRFRRGSEMSAALITASSAAIIGFAHGASTDMQLAGPFTAGMLCWFAWFRTERKWLLAVFYVFMAIGTLAKGPVAPGLAGLIIIVFGLVRRDWKVALRTLWIPGIFLFLVIALPWYVLVQMRNPEFFRVFVLEHNVARFATNLYRHKQPLWYYAPVLLAGTLPWTWYWLAAMWEAVWDWRGRAGRALEGERAPTPLE